MAEEQNPPGSGTVAGIEIPADLTALDDKGLESLKTRVAKAFQKINDKAKVSAEDLADMAALADVVDGIRAHEESLAAAQEEANAQREALAQRMAAAQPQAEEETPAEESTETTAVEAEAPSVEAEVTGEDEGPSEEEQGAAHTVIEALAASLRSEARGRGPATTAPRPVSAARTRLAEAKGSGEGYSIVASSGIPGTDTGSTLTRDGLSVALHERARMMGVTQGEKGALVASIKMDQPKNDVRNLKSDVEIREAWEKAHNVESLVASGGWCAPSETIYDFVCDFEAMPEALDLPSVTANRGGVRYPTSPLLGEVFDDVDSGFTWTEDDDIAAAQPGGPTKPCFTIPCPDFDEVRLQAQGICVTAGNLTDRAYPELTNRYVDLVMTAHAHRMNGLTIAKVVAASTAVAPIVADLSAAEAVLAAIELQIAASRDQFFMADDAVLEVVLPRWIRTVIRRDLARRGGVPFDQVDNGTIASFFSEIGARVQFVSNWQTLRQAGPFAGAVTLPATVDILIYPAGAHTRLDGGSLDLGVVRDSTLNATNDYTAAWTEEFWQVLSRCFSLVVTVPLCANGSAGALVTIDCPTA